MPTTHDVRKANAAAKRATAYLRSNGIVTPHLSLTVHQHWFGSFCHGTSIHLGCYPTEQLCDWFAMHELAHAVESHFRLQRQPRFRSAFGAPRPSHYEVWTATAALTPTTGLRPRGFPSVYAAVGGGSEHFADLVAFQYTQPAGFASTPPEDLAASWHVAWNHGLARCR